MKKIILCLLPVILFSGFLNVFREEYTVSYNANGANSGSAPAAKYYYEGDTVTVKSNIGGLGKTGCIFNCWNTSADGTGISYFAGDTFPMKTADVVLYAKWTVSNTAPGISYQSISGNVEISDYW